MGWFALIVLAEILTARLLKYNDFWYKQTSANMTKPGQSLTRGLTYFYVPRNCIDNIAA